MTHLDLRPEWRVYRRWSGGVTTAVVLFGVFGVVGVVSTWGDPHALLLVALGLLLVLVIALPALAHVAIVMRTSSLQLDAAQVVHRRYGRTTTLRLDGPVRGLLAPYVTPTGNGTTQMVDLLILVGTGGRIRLNGGYWSRNDLESVARATGATIDQVPRSAAEWERELPGSMGFVARRPVATAFLIVAGLFALIAGVVAIGVALS